MLLGDMKSTWSIDNFYIGKMPMNPSSMSEDFDSNTMSDSWLFINDGKLQNYCEHNRRWERDRSWAQHWYRTVELLTDKFE